MDGVLQPCRQPPPPFLFSLPPVALVPMEVIPRGQLPPLQPHRSFSRDLRAGITCKGVAALVPQIPHGLQHLVPRRVSTQIPLCAGIAAVLGQPWGRQDLSASCKARQAARGDSFWGGSIRLAMGGWHKIMNGTGGEQIWFLALLCMVLVTQAAR